MGKLLVFSNPVDGREDEYNKWYDETHLGEVVAIPSFKSAKRFRVSQAPGVPESAHRYLAIYEFDGPPDKAFENMVSAAGTLNMSDALSTEDALLVFVEDYE